MAKKVVAEGNKPTAKKQRVIEEEQKANEEKVEFSLEFTPTEEKAWIHEERCNVLVLVTCIAIAFVMGFVTAFISHTMGNNATAAAIDTALVFLVAALLKRITAPVVAMYIRKNYNTSVSSGATAAMLSGRSIAGAVFMYLVMALGSCIVFLNMLQ